MKKLLNSKHFLQAISVVIAIILWFYVVQVENPTFHVSISDIPVRFDNENILTERGLVVTSRSEESVTINVEGKRQSVSSLDKSSIVVSVDLKEITQAGTYSLTASVVFPDNTSSVVNKNMPKIRLTVEELKENQHAVRFETEGTAKDGYYPVIDHTGVTVSVDAPESIISDIAGAKAVININGADKDADTKAPVQLYDSAGNIINSKYVSISPSTVDIHCAVYPIKELTVEWKETGSAGVPVKLTPSVKTVRIAGPQAMLDSISKLNLGTIDMAKLTPNENIMRFSLDTIKELEGLYIVDDVTVITLTATFNPDITGKTEASFDVRNIELENVPDGFEAELVTPAVTVKVYADDASLEGFGADNIHIKADLSGYTEGEHDVPLTVTTDAENIHIDGDYVEKIRLYEKDKQ